METITQSANAYAFRGSATKPVNKADVCVVNGGIAELKGGKHSLKNVYGVGKISGGGNYRVLMASTPGTELVWDLRGCKHPRQTNGDEAALRAMGKAKKLTVYGVDFECRMHKRADGKWDYYKGWGAIRDIAACALIGGSAVGPWDVGEQENAGSPQTVGVLTVKGFGMTHMPRISRPKSAARKGRSGVKKIVFIDCPKLKATHAPIKKDGKVIGHRLVKVDPVLKNGKPVLINETWTPDS